MRVLIIGAGALGIAIGASLKKSGFNVDFLAREETGQAIRDFGIRREGLFEEIIIPKGGVYAYSAYEELPDAAYDFIIISVKTTANAEVSDMLNQYRNCMKNDCKIIFMQNGFYYEQPFLKYFDRSIIYHSRVITGFKRSERNVSTITVHQAPVLIGTLYGNPLEPVRCIAEAIREAGLPSEITEDVEKALWAKLIYNTTLNPLGAILGLSYGELLESEYARSIMDVLIEECFEIMNRAGYSTYWQTPEEYRKVLYEELIPDTAGHRSSTLQDIERKQKTEIDTLTGSLLVLASEYETDAPVQTMVYWMVKALEEKF